MKDKYFTKEERKVMADQLRLLRLEKRLSQVLRLPELYKRETEAQRVKREGRAGRECPNCDKYGVVFDENNNGKCIYCAEEFSEDDICLECDSLVKGSCYNCKMD